MKHIIIFLLSLTVAIQAQVAPPARVTPPTQAPLKRKPILSDFDGTWEFTFTNTAKRIYTISNGMVKWDGGPIEGKFTAQLRERNGGDGWICDFRRDKRLEVFFIDPVDRTIIIHHWDPIDKYKAGYAPLFTATSIKLNPPK